MPLKMESSIRARRRRERASLPLPVIDLGVALNLPRPPPGASPSDLRALLRQACYQGSKESEPLLSANDDSQEDLFGATEDTVGQNSTRASYGTEEPTGKRPSSDTNLLLMRKKPAYNHSGGQLGPERVAMEPDAPAFFDFGSLRTPNQVGAVKPVITSVTPFFPESSINMETNHHTTLRPFQYGQRVAGDANGVRFRQQEGTTGNPVQTGTRNALNSAAWFNLRRCLPVSADLAMCST